MNCEPASEGAQESPNQWGHKHVCNSRAHYAQQPQYSLGRHHCIGQSSLPPFYDAHWRDGIFTSSRDQSTEREGFLPQVYDSLSLDPNQLDLPDLPSPTN